MSNFQNVDPYGNQVVERPQAKGTAVLVLGIVGFLVPLCSIIGLVIGLQRNARVKRGELAPSSTLTAGVVLCIISLVLTVLGYAYLATT